MIATPTLAASAEPAVEIGDRSRIYRTEFGFDTLVASRTGAVHVTTASVSGVMTTPTLGRKVITRLDSVPVFSVDHGGHRLWVLLADPASSSAEVQRMTLRLFALDAMPVVAHSTIALPTPGDPRRVWLYPPAGRTRPALAELVDAVADAATRDGGQHA